MCSKVEKIGEHVDHILKVHSKGSNEFKAEESLQEKRHMLFL